MISLNVPSKLIEKWGKEAVKKEIQKRAKIFMELGMAANEAYRTALDQLLIELEGPHYGKRVEKINWDL